MSNFLAVAAVTATLSEVLTAGVADVTGAHVTFVRPDQAGAQVPSVNIFLYQVAPNSAWRNSDLPTRRTDESLIQRPRVALDLYYLFTFYGDETLFETQRLLGAVVRTLHAHPTLTRAEVDHAVHARALLSTSDLATDIELVKFTPITLSLDELSKLWSVFPQTHYALTITYAASVVFIEPTVSPRPALPVRTRNLVVEPFNAPVIEHLLSQLTNADPPIEGQPIFATSILVLRGQHLRGDVTFVRIDDRDVTPTSVAPLEVTLDLTTVPAGVLRPGIRSVQVVHGVNFGTPADPHPGAQSNAAALMISPRFTVAAISAAVARLHVTPQPAAQQRATILLNGAGGAFSFGAMCDGTDPVIIPMGGVPAGNYNARLQIDGVESPAVAVVI
jgi:hypothetical protein